MRGAEGSPGQSWLERSGKEEPPFPSLSLVGSGTEIKEISLTLGPVIRKLFTDLEDRDRVSREGMMVEGPRECLASQGSPLTLPGSWLQASLVPQHVLLPTPIGVLSACPAPWAPCSPWLCSPSSSQLLLAPLLPSRCPHSLLLPFALLIAASYTDFPHLLCSPRLAFHYTHLLLS